jgi:hypothetical protein
MQTHRRVARAGAIAVPLAIGLALSGMTFAGCAPRASKTHYKRWAEETEIRKAEEAKEEAAKAKATAEGSAEPGGPAKPPPPAPPSDFSSLDTPDITRTATKARVVRPPPPPPPDEDVIY